MMKKFLLLAIVLLVLSTGGCSGRSAEFGYVDMQKIVQESAKVKQIQENIEQKSNEFRELTEKEYADFDKEKTGLSRNAIEKKQQELQERQQLRQGEMMVFIREMEAEFQDLLHKTMNEVMQQKKLGAVLVKNSVLSGGTDITEEVLKKLN